MDKDYKRLTRSRTEKMLCGVCGGIGEYFNADPTLIRILWIVFSFASCGAALLAYFIAAIIVPEED